MRITVLGGGGWGTALAVHLSNNGNQVTIWEFFEEQAQALQTQRQSKFLPGVLIPDGIEITSSLATSLENSEAIFVVVPSNTVELTIRNASEFINKQPIVICSKGFASHEKLLSDVIKEHCSENNIYCLYGPNIAIEVAKETLSGAILAGPEGKERNSLQKLTASDHFKIDVSDDVIGLQVGAALKNVVTIFVGIVEGLNIGENTKAYIFVKGLDEITQIGQALGGKNSSFYGLNGLGDLLLKSRNRNLGIELGQGKKLEEILKDKIHVSEGVIAIENAIKIADRLNLKIPLIRGLNSILFENADPREVIYDI